MGDFDSSFSISTLLCQEDEACFNGDEEYHTYTNYCDPCFTQDEDEYIEMLVQKETTAGSTNYEIDGRSSMSHSWLKWARLDAIEWILSTRALFGFKYHTAYLSVAYFDGFLSKRSIDDGKLWAVRLLSVACLSLAAKMEECRVPGLSEFPIEDYRFETKVIQKMEILVLSTLDWKMASVTPFAYLHYLVSKICGESEPKLLITRAVELIVAIIKEINLRDYRPSTVAAAAVLAASEGKLTRKALELKMNVSSSWGFVENEHIFSCYKLMQEIEMGKVKTPKSVISPTISSIHSSSTDVFENSYIHSGAGIKRSLAFNDSDQDCTVKKICRW